VDRPWLERGPADAKMRLFAVVRASATAAHGAIRSGFHGTSP
jgi:hypothetical protein